MTATYRVAHFVNNPMLEARIPVAAIVEGHGRGVEVARAAYIPDSRCLGGAASEALLRLMLTQLDRCVSAGDPQPSLGPHFLFSDSRKIPAGVLDPLDWVRALLPRREPGARRGPKRSAEGWRYLRQRGVGAHVQRHFDPRTVLSHGAADPALPVVTHYVRGPGGLLLLEPIAPARAHALDDAVSISVGLTAYRWAMTQNRIVNPGAVRLAAYVLPDGAPERRAEIIAQLDPAAYQVIDTANASDAGFLVEQIAFAAGQRQI